MKVLKRISGLVFHHFWWKVLSLAIAAVTWALVATEPELGAFTVARLEYKNLPEDLEIASQTSPEVSLELRGPSGELRNLGDGSRPVVVLDMSTVTPGERTFAIGEANLRLSRHVHLVRAIPSEERFDFERRQVRTVPVKVRFTGERQNDYAVAYSAVQPSEVTIVGPASHVARIDSVVTDPVDVSNVVGTKEYHVNAFVEDPYVRFRASPMVVVTVTMKKVRGGTEPPR